MDRSATVAIGVSSPSMRVGTTTAAATNQGLIAGRPRALGASVTLLTRGLQDEEEQRTGIRTEEASERNREMMVQAVPVTRFTGRCHVRILGALFAEFRRLRLRLGRAEVGRTAAGACRRWDR